MIQIALYKGPPAGLGKRIAHWLTCAVLSARHGELCPYSHGEVVVNGVCYSSSVRDGGVRSKTIDLASGKWDVFDIDPALVGGEAACLHRFIALDGSGYDFDGAAHWLLPFVKQNPALYYCFEAMANMLGLQNPDQWGPLDLKRFALSKLNAQDMRAH